MQRQKYSLYQDKEIKFILLHITVPGIHMLIVIIGNTYDNHVLHINISIRLSHAPTETSGKIPLDLSRRYFF